MANGKKLIPIGYWYEVTPSVETGGRSERDAGKDPADFVDASWNAQERQTILGYIRAGRVETQWRGPSWCRMCKARDLREMGSADLTDGVYVWPQGYAHYIEKHGVRPPPEFVQHALSRISAPI